MSGWHIFNNEGGKWANHILGDVILYSHRKNHYTPSNYRIKPLHAHDYYELLIPIKGSAVFIANDQNIPLSSGLMLLLKPGTIHSNKIVSNSTYERYVFYFHESAFSPLGNDSSLLDFFVHTDSSCCLHLPTELMAQLLGGLAKLDSCLSVMDPGTPMLAYSHIIQLFYLLNHHATVSKNATQPLPKSIVKIKQYVDENYLTLANTSEIAEHFFYSREHISRQFRKCYNTNLSDYLTTLKVNHSKRLLEQGMTVTDACYQSGFRNMSTFASAFRAHEYMNPSSYRKKEQQDRSI